MGTFSICFTAMKWPAVALLLLINELIDLFIDLLITEQA